MPARDIVVVGTSAGGVNALKKLLADLPKDLPASVCLTIHLFRSSDQMLLGIFQRASSLPVVRAADGMELERGRVYLAPADCHLLFASDGVRLGHGPRENMQRPSINAMFRSAAAAFGERVVGIVLTGLLDDGAAGLWEIQQQGGVAIVQDPKEAEYPSMPQAALQAFDVDYAVGLGEMPALLERLAVEGGVRRSTTMPEKRMTVASMQTCPDCGGGMTEERFGQSHEYLCHIGHRYGALTMIDGKRAMQERALLAAMTQTEELLALLLERKAELDGAARAELELEVAALQETGRMLREILEKPPRADSMQPPDLGNQGPGGSA